MKVKNNTIKYLSAAIVMGCALPAIAQTQPADTLLNRTVVVEQQYNPEIMDAQKINVVPKVDELTVTPKEVEYDGQIAPATSLPGSSMQIYGTTETQPDAKLGYIRAGYGNYGNLDVRANYLFDISENDKLNINFGMDGRNGKLEYPYTDDTWKSHYYRTQAAIDYIHKFARMDMNIAGNVGLSNFNNMPTLSEGNKKFTSGDLHFGLKSTDGELPVQFNAETNLMLYSRSNSYLNKGSLNETQIRTKADVSGKINDDQRIGLNLGMDNRFYSYNAFENNTSVLLNPYYELVNDNWKLRLGVNVDLSLNLGDKFNASPDVSASYNFSDSYILYASATGGRLLNDYRRLETHNPHAELISTQLEDSYEQLNATLGFKASPVTGLWLNIFGGYQKVKNDLYSIFSSPEPGYTTSSVAYHVYLLDNTSNVFGGLNLNYDYKDVFSVAAKGVYRSWDSDSEESYYMKPEMDLGINIEVHPIKPLTIGVGYEYIQRAKVKDFDRIDAVNNLSLSASYNVFDGISVYARASNLLNKKYTYYPDYADMGANFLGGLVFRF